MARLELADALDFPLQANAGMLKHTGAHRFAEEFEFVAGGVPTLIMKLQCIGDI